VLPLASAAIVWLTNWLSEIAKASDAAAELLLSAEKPSDATIANKKIRKAIVMVACFKIYIPPYSLRHHGHISNYLFICKIFISE
jgi:hypothetical protein